MQRRSTVLIILGLLIAVPVIVIMQTNAQAGPPRQGQEDAARRGLQILKELVTQANYKDMGFQSFEEVSAATLGTPLHVFYVQPDKLRNYRSGTQPDTLLIDGQRLIYPVFFKDQLRSSVIIENGASGWQPTDFGGPNLIMLLNRQRRKDSDFVVSVPSLKIYFIANNDNPTKTLMLTPVLNDPALKMEAGQTLTADNVFLRLVPEAQSANGQPN